MGIVNDIKNILKESAEQCRSIAREINYQEDLIKRGAYSTTHINESIAPKIDGLRRSINEIKEYTRRTIHGMTAQYAEEARRADDLNPADMTEDCKLFTAGIKLTADDLRAIVNRNPNNRTMLQIVCRYADENGIKTGIEYMGSREAIETAQNVDAIANSFIDRWMESDNAESILQQYFTPKSEC